MRSGCNLIMGFFSWGEIDGISVPHINTHLDMLLLRTELESGTSLGESQLSSGAHSHHLTKPAWPPEL